MEYGVLIQMHPTFVRQLNHVNDAKFGDIQQVLMDFAVTQCFSTSMKISFVMSRSANEWSSPQTALAYLNVADSSSPAPFSAVCM